MTSTSAPGTSPQRAGSQQDGSQQAAAPQAAARLAVGLTEQHALQLLGDQTLRARFEAAPLAFVVVGTNRVGAAHTGAAGLDTGLVATALQQRAPGLRLLVASALQRDHPYSIARRSASLDVLSGGRTGLLLAGADRSWRSDESGADESGAEASIAWRGIDGQADIPLGDATVLDAAEAILKLWQSWPRESIIADAERGIYTEADRIRNVEHDGVYRIQGPISVPTSAQHTPVLAAFAGLAGAGAPTSPFDLLLAVGEDALPRESAQPVFEVLAAGGAAATVDAAEQAFARGRAGVVLTPEEGAAGLAELLTRTIPALAGEGIERSAAASTLREALGIPHQADRLAGHSAAFPAPVAQHRL